MKGELVKAFSKLLEFMSDVNVDILTKLEDFDCCIRKFTPYFPRNSQQDAQEFMRYLLHGLHEDVNRVKTKLPPITKDIDESLGEYEKSTKAFVRYLRNENSKIIDIFLGQLRSRLKCTVCGYSSVTFDPFWDLSISIPKGSVKVSLQQCLTLFTKEEILDAHEKPVCSRCRQRQRCSKRLTLHRFPNVLVLHLKRFNSTGRDYTKLPNSEIDYPLENLDLRPYSSGNGSKIPVYTLYAVVLHSGSDESGHYTATCRHPATKEWHHFNDLRVSKVLSTQVISPNAYILFYKLSNLCSRL
ncbi:ubiquitin carboxyl-terminal hydrolase 2-like [Tachypleus tridentatus]|uniref:ubiquitin carboxyl-terminal hydrolase 2-like n=1 Tax=Tachypleus tridentatus TaxID=6853 RepID=UPI003FD15FBB